MIYKIVCFFIFVSHFVFGQNLVLNAGFENCVKRQLGIYNCSDCISTNFVTGWYVPSSGSTDYFQLDKSRDSVVNFGGMPGGKCKPFEGTAFAGIIPYNGLTKEFREYLGGTFIKPLQSGQLYDFSFAVQLGNLSKYSVSEISIYFSEQKIGVTNTSLPLSLSPQLQIQTRFVSPGTWVILSGKYRATGGEQYFIIGNFNNDLSTVKKPIGKENKSVITWAYYYLDNISIEPILDENILTDSDTNAISPGKKLIARNIYFETNKYTILPSSYSELNSILIALKKNPSMKIEIDGHTDNIGSSTMNQKLSEDRAEAVANFFIQNGISSDRITWKGFGSSKPIGNDNSRNRRVEFIFHE